MPRHFVHRFTAFAAMMILSGASASGDFVVQAGGAGSSVVKRLRDNGQPLFDFNIAPLQSEDPFYLTGLGQDGSVYVINDEPGESQIERYNVSSGQRVEAPGPSFSGTEKISNFLAYPNMDVGPNGDLFVSGIDISASTAPVIQRINGQTGGSRSAYLFPDSAGFSDFAVRSATSNAAPYDADVFIAHDLSYLTHYRSSASDESGSVGSTPPSLFVESFNPSIPFLEQIKFGPDGLLYCRTASHSIVRYDVDARVIVDVLIPSIPNPFPFGPHIAADFTFGPDGDLFLTVTGSLDQTFNNFAHRVLRFDGQTGAPKGEAFPLAPAWLLKSIDSMVYVPIPEPHALPLLVAGASGIMAISHRRK